MTLYEDLGYLCVKDINDDEYSKSFKKKFKKPMFLEHFRVASLFRAGVMVNSGSQNTGMLRTFIQSFHAYIIVASIIFVFKQNVTEAR